MCLRHSDELSRRHFVRKSLWVESPFARPRRYAFPLLLLLLLVFAPPLSTSRCCSTAPGTWYSETKTGTRVASKAGKWTSLSQHHPIRGATTPCAQHRHGCCFAHLSKLNRESTAVDSSTQHCIRSGSTAVQPLYLNPPQYRPEATAIVSRRGNRALATPPGDQIAISYDASCRQVSRRQISGPLVFSRPRPTNHSHPSLSPPHPEGPGAAFFSRAFLRPSSFGPEVRHWCAVYVGRARGAILPQKIR